MHRVTETALHLDDDIAKPPRRDLEEDLVADLVKRHDLRRKGRIPWASYYNLKIKWDGGAKVGAYINTGVQDNQIRTRVVLHIHRNDDDNDNEAFRARVTMHSEDSSSSDPRCANPECPAPLGARLRACSRCLEAKYCTRACQMQAWPVHKTRCTHATNSS